MDRTREDGLILPEKAEPTTCHVRKEEAAPLRARVCFPQFLWNGCHKGSPAAVSPPLRPPVGLGPGAFLALPWQRKGERSETLESCGLLS